MMAAPFSHKKGVTDYCLFCRKLVKPDNIRSEPEFSIEQDAGINLYPQPLQLFCLKIFGGSEPADLPEKLNNVRIQPLRVIHRDATVKQSRTLPVRISKAQRVVQAAMPLSMAPAIQNGGMKNFALREYRVISVGFKQ